jgi:hypothetical protein
MFHQLAALIASIFMPLAIGAMWAVLSFRYGAAFPALALLCAAATWPARRHFAHAPRWLRALLCTGLCALGIAYAQWLIAASVVAREIGVGFTSALTRIGAEFSAAIAWARWSLADVAMICLALLVAFAIGAIQPGAAGRSTGKD